MEVAGREGRSCSGFNFHVPVGGLDIYGKMLFSSETWCIKTVKYKVVVISSSTYQETFINIDVITILFVNVKKAVCDPESNHLQII